MTFTVIAAFKEQTIKLNLQRVNYGVARIS